MRNSWMGRMMLAGALLLALVWQPPVEAAPKKKPKDELLDAKFLKMYGRAIQRLTQGDLDGAIGTAQTLLRYRPRSGRAMFLIGTAYKRKKLYSQAITNFQQASTNFKPKTEFFEKGQALYNIAMCYELQHQNQAAIAAWQVFITFGQRYPQLAQPVAFAQGRVKAMQSVKK